MTSIYKLWQPDIKKIDIAQLINSQEYKESEAEIYSAINKTFGLEYLHWKDLRYKSWIPQIYRTEPEKFWALVKYHRKFNAIFTPIRDENYKFFSWQNLPNYAKLLHNIDLDMARYLLNFPFSKSDHTKYQQQGIIEEAIASSQLEGAHVTRKVAKSMIEEKRAPRTLDERMILNNFLAMKAVEEKYKDKELDLEIIFELHALLTAQDGRLKEEEKGSLRKEAIFVGDEITTTYQAPSIEFVRIQLPELINFANDRYETGFIHPVIKAIMLHFWIGLLHPFIDGNGRLGRCLFYWYLLRKDYWAFAYLPISLAIKNSPKKYSDAYVFSEQDDNDLTYFIDYNLKKIEQAIKDFRNYAHQKTQKTKLENQKITKIMQKHPELNYRQTKAILDLHDNSHENLNVSSHISRHNVSKATAINDLKELLELGLVATEKNGRLLFYRPTTKINDIFKNPTLHLKKAP